MAKVKLNLPTGESVEKPVVTCFEVDNKKIIWKKVALVLSLISITVGIVVLVYMLIK